MGQDKRSSVVCVMDTISTANVVSSCSTLPPELPTRTFPTGTVTWSVSARTSPSSSPATRLMSWSERSRQRQSPSTERRTSNTTISPPSPTTISRSPSSGWPESSSETPLLNLLPPPPLPHLPQLLTLSCSPNTNRRLTMLPSCFPQMTLMPICRLRNAILWGP